MTRDGHIVSFHALAQSRTIVELLSALGKVTGTAVKLIPLGGVDGEVSFGKPVSPFCRWLTATQNGQAVCRRFLIEAGLRCREMTSSITVECPAGLTKICVPVAVGGQPRAILICGQFLCGKPTRASFGRTLDLLRRAQVPVHGGHVEKSFFRTTVISSGQQKLLRQLLHVLARQIGMLAEHWPVTPRNGEPPCVLCAKAFVRQHPAETLRTREAARAAHVTEPYFCRMFKAATGIPFTEYVARIRVEHAKELLANPALRVTDVAGAAGFQSIPHFNHTFKRYTGVNPSAYRLALRKSAAFPGANSQSLRKSQG